MQERLEFLRLKLYKVFSPVWEDYKVFPAEVVAILKQAFKNLKNIRHIKDNINFLSSLNVIRNNLLSIGLLDIDNILDIFKCKRIFTPEIAEEKLPVYKKVKNRLITVIKHARIYTDNPECSEYKKLKSLLEIFSNVVEILETEGLAEEGLYRDEFVRKQNIENLVKVLMMIDTIREKLRDSIKLFLDTASLEELELINKNLELKKEVEEDL